ncbi:uncharacterized protein BX663DRAFT_585843 [Cokeromyces recurvatus]|uniref:uncharacterized protein n=1 Tax=Cokeromyces recurvatus TaxID=90255 RepID=UPI00221F25FD|nr:uncharacterized protein BX663DRAFT_585843 [Cokeromyces recurvatus]KAI7905344.1 hypothetical protein BX663DRAFT_585843 [Cokeromyces recurvatus]
MTNNTAIKSSNNGSVVRMHPLKRPRAPIACYRCHHKKVRCDGIHPNCTRCLTTGVICAYPTSRRSRNTQPTNVDPFIDNLSQLEARIRKIETDLESQRALVRTVVCANNNNDVLTHCMLKTEKDLQESRSIVAQLRLVGEQRVARGRRAARAELSSDKKLMSSQKRRLNTESNTAKSSINKDKRYSNTNLTNPSLTYYFTQQQPFSLTDSSFPTCWPLLNDNNNHNEFVDPMIIAAAMSTTSSSTDDPLLTTSNYTEDSMNQQHHHLLHHHLHIPGLQPSSSPTSTSSSSNSFSGTQQQAIYTRPFIDEMIIADIQP